LRLLLESLLFCLAGEVFVVEAVLLLLVELVIIARVELVVEFLAE